MAKADVDFVRGIYSAMPEDLAAAYRDPDFLRDADLLDPAFDPEFEFEMASEDFTGLKRSYRGLSGYLRAMQEWTSAWESWVVEPQEFREHDGRVLVLSRLRGQSKTAGVEMDVQGGEIWTLRDGRVLRIESYLSRSELLSAAGAG